MLRRRTILKIAQAPTGDTSTKLLLHFDGSVVDSSIYAIPVSASAGTSYAPGKFGQGFIGYSLTSMSDPFPLVTPAGYLNDIISSDFTIDMWIDSNSIDSTYGAQLFYIGCDSSFENGTLLVAISPAGGNPLSHYFSIYSVVNNANVPLVQASYPASNMSGWFHFALTAFGSMLRLFVNGTLIASYSSFDGHNSSYDVSVLCPSTIKIDELRVSNVARWADHFTPPTAPY